MKSHYSGSALKKGALQYLYGKAATAALTFALLLTMVRVLTLADYGIYLVFTSVVELCIALSGFGIPWIASRYLPEYRVHSTGDKLQKFCKKLVSWQILGLMLSLFVINLMLGFYLESVGLVAYRLVAQCFTMVVFIEGLARFYRDFIFGPLLLQKQARVSLVFRHLTLFIIVASLGLFFNVELIHAAFAELMASSVGLFLAYFAFRKEVSSSYHNESKSEWVEPPLKEHWNVALQMYCSHLLTLAYSPHVFINIIQRYLGPEVTALFGFFRSFNDQIARNLPANLLINMIRPKLIANYVGGGGIRSLVQDSNLAGKLSLFALMPLIVFAAIDGSSFINLISAGKFVNTNLLLFGFMAIVLIPYSQRQLLESIAVVVGLSRLCTIAAFSGLFMLPLMYTFLENGLGIWSPILTIGIGNLLFNIVLVVGLRPQGYTPDHIGVLKIFFSGLITYSIAKAIGSIALFSNYPQIILLLISGFNTIFIYIFVSFVVKPFQQTERDRVNRVINRKLFIW